MYSFFLSLRKVKLFLLVIILLQQCLTCQMEQFKIKILSHIILTHSFSPLKIFLLGQRTGNKPGAWRFKLYSSFIVLHSAPAEFWGKFHLGNNSTKHWLRKTNVAPDRFLRSYYYTINSARKSAIMASNKHPRVWNAKLMLLLFLFLWKMTATTIGRATEESFPERLSVKLFDCQACSETL